MVEVTPAIATRISEVAWLLESEESSDATLLRLTGLAVGLVPGTTAAAVTIAADGEAHTFAASDARIDELHHLQFSTREGPVVETLRHNEARHVRDVGAERRWPAFCRAAAAAGFGSCIVLPLHTGGHPAAAVALYGERPGVFSGATHDLALLFAAQGGAALHNAEIYGTCQQMVRNLQSALEARALIEQAKGILHAELGVSPDEAFQALSRTSQNTNQKVRDLARRLVQGEISPQEFRARPSRNG